jgi:predicted DsbA family dithiol-disulfide isomerase
MLNTSIPPEGENLMEHLSKKYGPSVVKRFSQPDNPLDNAGAKVGITFNKNSLVIPTLTCHRAVEWCNKFEPEKTDLFMETLFQAYFTNAKNVNSIEEILVCAAIVELNTSVLRDVLESSDEFTSEVSQRDAHAKRNLGVTGVPYFIIECNNTRKRPITFSGAQVLVLLLIHAIFLHYQINK